MNITKQSKVTEIKYHDKESEHMEQDSYWEIFFNVTNPINGTVIRKSIHTVSANEVLQVVVSRVIPDLELEIEQLKSRKWYQFWR